MFKIIFHQLQSIFLWIINPIFYSTKKGPLSLAETTLPLEETPLPLSKQDLPPLPKYDRCPLLILTKKQSTPTIKRIKRKQPLSFENVKMHR
jgi:hypothetical protein